MAARRERSALDTTKLLELLLRLAKSDTEVGLLTCQLALQQPRLMPQCVSCG